MTPFINIILQILWSEIYAIKMIYKYLQEIISRLEFTGGIIKFIYKNLKPNRQICYNLPISIIFPKVA
ncbi:hypothetical protein BKK48_05280 [Rodentibacter heidelbergensis]|uniref:Uncharacterized protein n=1 Tax=Rodentibacter heidelbergensis TaxID=1908258 RepID=A0A1V3I9G8_9PAST|nr:hypothetical protein BKK48_05280 [Rodentibacter heidelbergensis]